MTDVRLTALNPVDSQVYPVACNTSGELIVEQVAPGPDLTVTGNLTVDGTSTFNGITNAGNITTSGSTQIGDNAIDGANKGAYISAPGRIYVTGSSGNETIWSGYTEGSNNVTSRITAAGNISLAGTLISYPSGAAYAYQVNNGTTNLGGLYKDTSSSRLLLGDGSATNVDLQGSNGSATFVGDITINDNSKGLILKSSNGTLYRLSVADNGAISTSIA